MPFVSISRRRSSVAIVVKRRSFTFPANPAVIGVLATQAPELRARAISATSASVSPA